MVELAPVDGECCAGRHRKAGEQDEWRKPSHPILRSVLHSRACHPRFASPEDNSSGGGVRMHAQIMSDVAAVN